MYDVCRDGWFDRGWSLLWRVYSQAGYLRDSVDVPLHDPIDLFGFQKGTQNVWSVVSERVLTELLPNGFVLLRIVSTNY